MAGRRIGDKPLSEPTLNRFTDAYMRHWGRLVNSQTVVLVNYPCFLFVFQVTNSLTKIMKSVIFRIGFSIAVIISIHSTGNSPYFA